MFRNDLNNEEKQYLFAEIPKNEGKNKRKLYSSNSSSYKDINVLVNPVFPIAVILVLLSKTFEATAANGIRSILSLFLRDSLMLSERFSIIVLHTFNFISQFLPIISAIISDCYLGTVKTLLIFFVPYAIGYFLLFASTFPYLFTAHLLVYASLLLIGVGNGFLRACITTLGANQYILPQQRLDLDRYFSGYYFFYYVGILIGKILPPYMRKSVLLTSYCMEIGECYTTVFGFLTITFLISWILFLSGLKLYKKEYPTLDNTMIKTIDCILHAVIRKICLKSTEKNFLDNSIGRHSQEFVEDVRTFLKIIKLFLPLPIFYALLNQQDSTFTFQATLTDTNIMGIEIQPDQFKSIGPIILLILIPIWEKIITPLLTRCGIYLSSLECMFIGCLFATLSFVCAGLLQHFIIVESSVKQYSVLWQFPQFLFIMIAELLISIHGLKYAYTNAPSSMKSLLTAIFFMNNAFGNLLVIIITQIGLFKENHAMDFLFYAFFMLIATILIKFLAHSHDKDFSQDINEEKTFEAFICVNEIQASNMEENI